MAEENNIRHKGDLIGSLAQLLLEGRGEIKNME